MDHPKSCGTGCVSGCPCADQPMRVPPRWEKYVRKVERYNKIAAEAAKQSGRGILPEVAGLMSLEAAAKEVCGKGIVFYEKGGARLTELVNAEIKSGAFLWQRRRFFGRGNRASGRVRSSAGYLGKRILRCETAPICGLSVMLSLLGDI